MRQENLASVDLNLLVMLEALLLELHVTRAARRVGVSQPAMSRALSRLRVVFGDPLLVRSSEGMRPTPRALSLRQPLEALLVDARALLRNETIDPRTARGTVRVAANDHAQATLLPTLVETLTQVAPGLRLELRPTAMADDLQAAMARGEVDLAIGPPDTFGPHLRQRVLFVETFRCLLRQGHPLAQRRKLTRAQYVRLDHVFVSPRGLRGGPVQRRLDELQIERRLGVIVPSFLLVPLVLERTDFVFTCPTRLARELAARHGLVELAPPVVLPEFAVAMTWHPRMHADPTHRFVRESVVQAAAA